mmetsp:Transcript_18593/g.30332  ORF Transcript_18593/g.30332 Transcript_18593/m.30332 type:complete len:610 (-) Transcript_18593:51-1880(-)
MKGAGLVLAGALAATSAGMSEGITMDINAIIQQERMVVRREIEYNSRNLQVTQASGAMCATQEPCMSSNCMYLATVVALPVCADALASFDDVIGPQACDNECMGIAALLTDSEVDETSTKRICTAFKSDDIATQCVQTTPFKAVLETMDAWKDSHCSAFNNELLTFLNAPENKTETGNETETPHTAKLGTAQQIALINQVAAGYLNATGYNATRITSALAKSGVGLYDFFSLFVGLMPQVFPSVSFMQRSEVCIGEQLAKYNLTDPEVGAVLGLMASRNITEPEIQTFLANKTMAEVASKMKKHLEDNVSGLFDKTLNAIVTSLTNQTYANSTQFGIDLYADVIANCSAVTKASSITTTAASTCFDLILTKVSQGTTNLTDQTSVDTAMGDCTVTQAESLETKAALGEYASCWATKSAPVNSVLQNLTTHVATVMATTNIFKAINTFQQHMGMCMDPAGFAPLAEIFANFTAGSQDPVLLQFIKGASMTIGCQLAKNGLTEGAAPQIVSMTTCYMMAIQKSSGPLLKALVDPAVNMTLSQLVSTKDCMGNLATRCEDAGVPLGHVGPPTPAPVSPTTPPTTAPPTGLSTASQKVLSLLVTVCTIAWSTL